VSRWRRRVPLFPPLLQFLFLPLYTGGKGERVSGKRPSSRPSFFFFFLLSFFVSFLPQRGGQGGAPFDAPVETLLLSSSPAFLLLVSPIRLQPAISRSVPSLPVLFPRDAAPTGQGRDGTTRRDAGPFSFLGSPFP